MRGHQRAGCIAAQKPLASAIRTPAPFTPEGLIMNVTHESVTRRIEVPQTFSMMPKNA